jgi:3D (Asp-Asp-Asp) domain-containing protein
MGLIATKGIIAVDPRVIPLGTRVFVDGYGPAIAADTGGAIHGSHIDVCFDSRSEALRWGRRTVQVMILE